MTEEMSGNTEAAFLSAIKLHVTGNLALIRAAEEELIKNKVSPVLVVRAAGLLLRPVQLASPVCAELHVTSGSHS